MAYTPEFSQIESGIVRRIAWAMGVPMTRAHSEMIQLVARSLDPTLICQSCRDKSFCPQCPFNNPNKSRDRE